MKNKEDLYKHYIQFIPSGTNPHTTDKLKTYSITNNTLKKGEVVKSMYRKIQTDRTIDSYGIRNHWDVFNMDVEFNNPPWDGWTDLLHEINSHSMTVKVSEKENYIFVSLLSIDKNTLESFCQDMNNYYPGLNPKIDSGKVRLVVYPKYV